MLIAILLVTWVGLSILALVLLVALSILRDVAEHRRERAHDAGERGAVTPMGSIRPASPETPRPGHTPRLVGAAGSAGLGVDDRAALADVVRLDDWRYERAARGGAA